MADECVEQTATKKQQPSTAELIRRLLEFVKPERQRLAVACIAMTLTSATNLAFPKIIAGLIDAATTQGSRGAAAQRKLVLYSLGMFSVGATGSWLRTYLFQTVTDSVARRLRKLLVKSLMQQEMAFFDQNRVGDMVERMSNDVTITASSVTGNLAKGYRNLNSAIGGSVLLLWLSPKLTLVSLAVVPLVGMCGMLYGIHARKLSKAVKQEVARVTAVAEERLSNMKTVRLFAMEDQEAASGHGGDYRVQREHALMAVSLERPVLRRLMYAAMLDRTAGMVQQAAHAEGVLMGGLMLGGFSSLVAVIAYGGSLVRSGKLTVGSLTSFAGYSAMVGIGFSGLSQLYGETVKSLSSAARVFEVIDRTPAVDQTEGKTLPKVEGRIKLEGVHFSYPSRPDVEVLRGVDLTLERGEVLALCGASGSGKSTTAALLTRLYEPSAGRVLLDGTDVASLSARWLRRQVAVVSQEPLLFAESIAANIAYGTAANVAYGAAAASQQQIDDAAEQANAMEFIQKFTDGMQTNVGERGAQVSGGQKQRIAIARAIIKDPAVLILDEATSALDNESDRLVRDALEKLMRGRTTLLIAHRASTIQTSTRIAVLSDGRVAEEGGYEELLANDVGVFKQLMDTLRHGDD